MITRRKFVGSALVASSFADSLAESSAESVVRHEAVPVAPRNPRPYAGIDWDSCVQIHTTSHGHSPDQRFVDAYINRGFELLSVSNYYPSTPWVPLSEIRENQFRVRQDFPVIFKGRLVNGPFDWNKIVGEWANELPEAERAQFPFKVGKRLFKRLPEGVLEAPNAEHHHLGIRDLHVCTPGSNYKSGTFDARNRFGTLSRGYHFGCGERWEQAFPRMLKALVYPDGGGITINHPHWSRLNRDDLLAMLDFDPQVLGIEVYNQSCTPNKSYPWSRQFAEDYWDYALSNGRQCFGFFVPDWSRTEGVNILVTAKKTVRDCLRAYRLGNFYGAVKGRGILNFRQISFDGATLRLKTDKPAQLTVVSAGGIVADKVGSELEYRVDGRARKFIRAKAYASDGSGEILFTQPFMI